MSEKTTTTISLKIPQKTVDKLKGLARKEAIRRGEDYTYTALIRDILAGHLDKKATRKPVGVIESFKKAIADKDTMRALAAKRPMVDEPPLGEDTLGHVAAYFADRDAR